MEDLLNLSNMEFNNFENVLKLHFKKPAKNLKNN